MVRLALLGREMSRDLETLRMYHVGEYAPRPVMASSPPVLLQAALERESLLVSSLHGVELLH